MFVGALFRDSSWKILQHYRGLVDEVEREAEELARKQIEEQEARQEYLENVSIHRYFVTIIFSKMHHHIHSFFWLYFIGSA